MNKLLFLSLFISNALLAQQAELVVPIGHTNVVTGVQFSPNGKFIATCSSDGSAKIWEALTGKLVVNIQIEYEEGGVHTAYFSPDGKWLVTTSAGNTIKIWGALSGKLQREINGHISTVYSAEYSPDGKFIVSASNDGTTRIWDAVSGKPIRKLQLLNKIEDIGGVTTARFNHNGKNILTVSSDGFVKVWDVASGKLVKSFKVLPELDYYRSVSAQFSPDGKNVVTDDDSTVKIWSIASGKSITIMQEAGSGLFSASYSSHGNFISVITGENTVNIWDIAQGKIKTILPGHGANINSTEFSPDEKFIVTTSDDTTAKIWETATGNLLADLRGHGAEVWRAIFSPDGKYIATASADQTAIVWETHSSGLVTRLMGHTSRLSYAEYSPDGKNILEVSGENRAGLWEVRTGRPIREFIGHTGMIHTAHFSPGGKYIVTAAEDSSIKLWETATGKLKIDFRGEAAEYTSMESVPCFSPDGKYLSKYSSRDSSIRIWEMESGKLISKLEENAMFVYSTVFNPDGKTVMIHTLSYVKVWEITTGKLVATHPYAFFSIEFSRDGKYYLACERNGGIKVWVTSANKIISDIGGFDPHFSPDGKYVLTKVGDTVMISETSTGKFVRKMQGSLENLDEAEFSPAGKYVFGHVGDNAVSLWEMATGKFVHTYESASWNLSFSFSPDDKRIVTTSTDNTGRVWEAASGKLLYSFLRIGHTDHFTWLNGPGTIGYYAGTKDATKLLTFRKGGKQYSFDQFDLWYNRPDKVLEAMGNTDTALINAYRRAYYKRIKKQGVDTSAFKDGFNVPQAEIQNRDAIDYDQRTGQLTLHVRGQSSVGLNRFNVWVNEVPVYGLKGIGIGRDHAKGFDTTVIVKLSPGGNSIESSVTDISGTESLRVPLQVNYTSLSKPAEMMRFIGIGIDHFADPQYDLRYSVKDIRDLSRKLKEKYGDAIFIDTLFNENVTVNKVKALKQKLLESNENDKVILAYSGHGLLSKDFDYYLSTYAVNFTKPEQNGLPYDELENLLDSIPARQKLMLIDACHSGEVDKEDLIALNAAPDSLARSLKPVAYKKEGQLGLMNSFELMQNLFVNVGKSTGATIISAAAGTQFALERKDFQNGVFTYCILQAMNQHKTITVSALRQIVSVQVYTITGGLQQPTSRNENKTLDWKVW